MSFRHSQRLRLVTAVFAWFAILTAQGLHAQAPPGPLPQTPSQDSSTASPVKPAVPNVPRTKILAGTWRLNMDESDDPAKKLQQGRETDNGSQGRGRRGGMGGGWPGGGMGGRGGMGGAGRGVQTGRMPDRIDRDDS